MQITDTVGLSSVKRTHASDRKIDIFDIIVYRKSRCMRCVSIYFDKLSYFAGGKKT